MNESEFQGQKVYFRRETSEKMAVSDFSLRYLRSPNFKVAADLFYNCYIFNRLKNVQRHFRDDEDSIKIVFEV